MNVKHITRELELNKNNCHLEQPRPEDVRKYSTFAVPSYTNRVAFSASTLLAGVRKGTDVSDGTIRTTYRPLGIT